MRYEQYIGRRRSDERTLQKGIYTYKVERTRNERHVQLLQQDGTEVEDFRTIQGVQNNRPYSAQADRPAFREQRAVEDVRMPFVRQIPRHSPGGQITQEQTRPEFLASITSD